MELIKVSIKRPVTILSIIFMLVMFGIISLKRIPYQLSPSVIEPEITVTTTWRGATPYEIEREIIEEQENTLKGLPDLVEMESTSRNSQGSITLRFKVGTNVDDVLLRVSNKLNEVPSYPNGSTNRWLMLQAHRLAGHLDDPQDHARERAPGRDLSDLFSKMKSVSTSRGYAACRISLSAAAPKRRCTSIVTAESLLSTD